MAPPLGVQGEQALLLDVMKHPTSLCFDLFLQDLFLISLSADPLLLTTKTPNKARKGGKKKKPSKLVDSGFRSPWKLSAAVALCNQWCSLDVSCCSLLLTIYLRSTSLFTFPLTLRFSIRSNPIVLILPPPPSLIYDDM